MASADSAARPFIMVALVVIISLLLHSRPLKGLASGSGLQDPGCFAYAYVFAYLQRVKPVVIP